MRASKLLCFPAVVLLCCFVCRAQDYAAIRGNWHLTGSWGSSSTSPRLVLTIGVDGDEVLAIGGLSIRCPHRVGLGAGLAPKGQIAADGTFLLTESIPNRITISGRIPEPGSGQWAGHYNFSTDTGHGECSTGGDFVATKLPLLKGVFSGTLQLADHSGEVAVTIDINQGELIRLDNLYWVPLQATMTLSGSAEFPSERLKTAKFPPEGPTTATSGPTMTGGQITGESFAMHFSANDGEQIMLGGYFIDASEQRLQVQLDNQNSKNVALGTLSRQ